MNMEKQSTKRLNFSLSSTFNDTCLQLCVSSGSIDRILTFGNHTEKNLQSSFLLLVLMYTTIIQSGTAACLALKIKIIKSPLPC